MASIYAIFGETKNKTLVSYPQVRKTAELNKTDNSTANLWLILFEKYF